MAPSPAAGGRGGLPKTPTKAGRKPQSSDVSSLGEQASSATSKAAPRKLGTPKAPQVQKPETESPQLPARPSADDAQGSAKGLARRGGKATKNVPEPSKVEMKDASEAGEADDEDDDELGQVEPKPVEEAEDTVAGAQDTAKGAAEDVEEEADDVADDATEKAGEVGEGDEEDDDDDDAQDDDEDEDGEGEGQGGPVGGLGDKAKGLASKAEGFAGKATEDPAGAAGEAADDVKDTAEEGVEDAQETAEDAADEAGDAVDDAQDAAEDATGQELPEIPGLEILKGLEVDEEGLVRDSEGNAIGKLVEGDAEDLAGYTIGDEGEILDDDGDLVGRTELLPEKIQQLKDEAEQQAEDAGPRLPGLDALNGLTVDSTGLIYNDDGDTIGQLTEGNPADLQGLTANEEGEFIDDEGNVVGRAKIHPEAPPLEDDEEEGEDEGEEEGDEDEEGEGLINGVEDAADGVADEAEGAVDEAGDAVPDLPGVEALEGMEINEEGQIVDEEGNVLGEVAEGDIDQVKGLTVNDQGEVVDEEGNVLGRVELAEGAAEKLAEAQEATGGLQPDVRILNGLKVNKKGKILDGDGEEIGQLTDGDPAQCAGKKVNEQGEVLDKEGNVIGHVEVVPGEAADEAMKELAEELGIEIPGAEPEPQLPGLDILDGLKVNKKGQVLDEDGEPIGELIEGDLSDCAGKKINDKGEVLDKDGNVIGKVQTLPQTTQEAAEDAQETAEDAQETAEEALDEAQDDTPQLPPLDILEGLTVNKAGKLIDDEGNVVGELIEGDAKKLSKLGITADAEGQFWDNKGHVIGRAQTVAQENAEEEAPFAGLEGLIVNKEGYVEDENGNVVGQVVEGDAKKLVGRAVDEDGDIIDKKGSVVGHAERIQEEEQPEEEPEDLSILAGKTVNKQGNVIGDDGTPIGRLVEGNPKELAGKKIDANGQIWNDKGEVIGRCELIPEEEREVRGEGPFAGLQGLHVIQGGQIADEEGNVVGTIVEGNPKRLVGLAVDEDGDILDKYGNVKGHAEPLEEEEEEAPADLSVLDGLTLNKQGYLVGQDGIPIGRLVEGNLSDLAGRKSDGEGLIHNDTGKVVGRCELIPENERVTKSEGPFAGLEGLRVNKEGYVEDEDGNVVGVIVEGNAKRLVGHAVDEDGDIIDKYGNVKGHADPWEAEEEPEADLSALAGCTVNKAGNVVDANGKIIGRITDGDPKSLVGKKVDGKGQIWDSAGNVVGHAELATGVDTSDDGPFSGFDTATVAKDGTVQLPDGTIIGRVIEGDLKKLVGHTVDEDGDISDKNGNTLGKAERWEPEEKERRINPMAGRRVNKKGEVVDENGDTIGRLTAGDLGHCVGLEIDDNGYVVDNDGNRVGEVTLLENIVEEEEEEESEEDKQKREDAEIASKMNAICVQTLERVQPICKQITEHIEAADRTPKEELDEEQLVNDVKPLIEEGGRILQECNGSLRGLDPDGRIANQAKGRAQTREATPEEYQLADSLKELTTTVVTTIDNAKKKINDMPHAKKKLNPLWGLLTEPLFQIIAAVGLLLSGVLGLVGKLLNGLGLGGLVNGLLGGLGIDKLLGGLGLGGIGEALGGGDKKKKRGGGGLPIVGGLLGGK